MTQPIPGPTAPPAAAPAPAPAPKKAPKPPAAKPKPAAAKPPPKPPATPQKQVAKPVQQCPLMAEKPCDVDKLTMTVEIFGEDAAVRKVETTRVRTRDPVTDVKNKTALDLLGRYDLIVDTVAGYPSREDPYPRHRIQVQAKAEFHGRQCPVQQHPVLEMKPLTKANELAPQGIVVHGKELPPKLFLAEPISPDLGVAGGNLLILIEIIRSLWPTAHPKMIEVTAHSCGKKARGAGTPPNGALKGLVRVYRKDLFLIGIKLPPLGSFSHERAGKVTGERERSKETEYSAGFGYAKGKRSSETSGEGLLGNYEHKETRWRGGKGSEYSQSREVEHGSVKRTFTERSSHGEGRKIVGEDGSFHTEALKELEKQGPIALVIKRNGREVTNELFGGGPHKPLKEKVIEALVKGIETVAKAIETFNKMPQLGWKFEFKIALFEGTIGLEWGPDYADGPLAGGRYYPVALRVVGKIELELLSLEASISFGVEARALGTGIIAKIEGRFSLRLPVETEIRLNERKPRVEIEIHPEAEFAGIARGYASIIGYSLVDAQLTASVAITMDDGKIEVSAHEGMRIEGTLRREPIELKGFIKVPVWGLRRIDPPVKLCEGAVLHRFG